MNRFLPCNKCNTLKSINKCCYEVAISLKSLIGKISLSKSVLRAMQQCETNANKGTVQCSQFPLNVHCTLTHLQTRHHQIIKAI